MLCQDNLSNFLKIIFYRQLSRNIRQAKSSLMVGWLRPGSPTLSTLLFTKGRELQRSIYLQQLLRHKQYIFTFSDLYYYLRVVLSCCKGLKSRITHDSSIQNLNSGGSSAHPPYVPIAFKRSEGAERSRGHFKLATFPWWCVNPLD